jgi:basic membrane lipoprotein Med (substrate-binding protein (PBP1-ABC) superfamily)
MCKAGRLRLEQELGLKLENKVLELPKQRLDSKRIRGNQSIKESIQEVV